MDKHLTTEDLSLLMRGLDAALDYMECLDDDVLQSVYDAYDKIYQARSELYSHEIEVFRAHLERSFAT
jgi:hypothetical protein